MDNVWLAALIGIGTALGGGTGIATLLRVRHEKKLGLAAQEVSEDDAVTKRLLELADAQMRALVAPLEARLAGAEKRIAELEGQVRERDAEITRLRTSYWRAIAYIRQLLAWIRANNPSVPVPEPHADLVNDI